MWAIYQAAAFNNEKIYNIAISGPYGSGKSSIINSYIKKHPELKVVNISLANFLTLNKNDDIDSVNQNLNDVSNEEEEGENEDKSKEDLPNKRKKLIETVKNNLVLRLKRKKI